VGAVKRSLYESQDEILEAIRALHVPEGFEADLTFGNGGFWRTQPRPRLCFDATPLAAGVVEADSRLLPLEPSSIGSAVFDPPFLTYVRGGREHKDGKVAMTARFGGYWSLSELEDHYRETISECWRVLRPGGVLVFKCQDIVHNHRLEAVHAHVLMMADAEGFDLLDLFVLAARHRMPGPQKGTQRHARVFHSYFLVFRKPTAKQRGRRAA